MSQLRPTPGPGELPYHKLTRAHLFDYYEFMRLNYASKTCNTNYSSIRSVMQQAVSMGLMTALESMATPPSRPFLPVPRYVGAVSWSRSRRSAG